MVFEVMFWGIDDRERHKEAFEGAGTVLLCTL